MADDAQFTAYLLSIAVRNDQGGSRGWAAS